MTSLSPIKRDNACEFDFFCFCRKAMPEKTAARESIIYNQLAPSKFYMSLGDNLPRKFKLCLDFYNEKNVKI
jgi:hypothetical protein